MDAQTKVYKIKKVMIIDDNEIDLMIARNIMIQTGFAANVLAMSGGVEALEYLNNYTEENSLPEVIFLDINMPGMDGFGFLTTYARCQKKIKDHCKIVVLTSSTHPKDLRTMLNNPYVVRFISKPLTPDDLIAIYSVVKS